MVTQNIDGPRSGIGHLAYIATTQGRGLGVSYLHWAAYGVYQTRQLLGDPAHSTGLLSADIFYPTLTLSYAERMTAFQSPGSQKLVRILASS
jgi:hypothetical protein